MGKLKNRLTKSAYKIHAKIGTLNIAHYFMVLYMTEK